MRFYGREEEIKALQHFLEIVIPLIPLNLSTSWDAEE